MGAIHQFNPVKLFTGALVSSRSWIPEIEERLTALYGPIDHRSETLPFDFTDYYEKEMGFSIDRVFFSFTTLIDAQRLPEIKQVTNALEGEFAGRGGKVTRPVNLDPGYLENAKVVLASTKNFYHRIYLGDGIFGEVTMRFSNNTFQFFPWTYPDYQSSDYQEFFMRVRQIYRSQLKTMCQLKER
ncbi:MAG TPA: DUF4416 family protein [Terriglobia bacterium]|nr:DUF4416 family protein [Terriglobia bacterium]